eukprot:GHVR01177305.1.p1 GENE.GHVR01177305.1~~GHVR01177305.1.p1  ORF type:complete len:103 (-),score=47.79 GHVR01177305.1:7-315(-)
MGHSNCGAVAAAANDDDDITPGLISSLFYHIRPSLRACDGDCVKAVYENVRYQAIQLADVSPVIRVLVRRRDLIVVGGVYDLTSGVVEEIVQIEGRHTHTHT